MKFISLGFKPRPLDLCLKQANKLQLRYLVNDYYVANYEWVERRGMSVSIKIGKWS